MEHADKGFVKLKRDILEWEWYHNGNMLRVMIHILLKANYTEKKWQGIVISPSELITSTATLQRELVLPANVIRNCLKKLKETNYIEMQSTNKYTKIKVLKSTLYNDLNLTNNEQNSSQAKNKRHSENNPTTTTNKVNKEKEDVEKIESFKNEILKFSNSYSKEHLDSFSKYWLEKNQQTGRARFIDNSYWYLERNLKNWKVYTTPESLKTFTKNR